MSRTDTTPSAFERWSGLGAIDRRSLTAFRIALGATILCDLVDRARDLRVHYTDEGVLPVAMLGRVTTHAVLCLHALSGSPIFVAALFLVAALAAILLILGRWTRAASVVSWVLLTSLQARNPLVFHLGDTLLRLLALWAIFLPLAHNVEAPRRSIAAAALQLQVAFLYWFAAAQKTGADWMDGTAVHYALSYGMLARPFATFLLEFPSLIAPLTYGTLVLEWLGPFLLLLPGSAWRVRVGAIAAFAALQHGFWLAFDLGIFPLASIAALLPFLPARFWDVVGTPMPDVRPLTCRERAFGRLVPAPLLALVFYINVASLPVGKPLRSRTIYNVAAALRVDQSWSMFAPNVSRHDGWLQVGGTRRDGTELPISLERPTDIKETQPTQRWRLYMVNLTKARWLTALPIYHAYACRTHDLAHLKLHFLLTITPPPLSEKATALQDRVIWDAACPPSVSR